MRELTSAGINTLAARPGVRRIAVENFLGSMAEYGERAAVGNLRADAASYRWNSATQSAIAAGIKMACKPAKVAR